MTHDVHKFAPAAIVIVLSFLLPVFLSPAASALSEVEVNPVYMPKGAVILISDGLSAPFIYPELTPHALDGTPLKKALLENIPAISKDSARVLDIRAPQTFTEGGHSVLVTGNSKANSEMVSFKDATIYDVARKHGYLCFAVMEKGDSYSVCAEQDAILHDKNNSITKMSITFEPDCPNPGVPAGLVKLMKEASARAGTYVQSKEARKRYNGYDRWGIETACSIVEYMGKNCPDQKYLLTVNVGAVDMSGHYRKNSGYIDCIENLDTELLPLYKLCKENELAFVLTADHGMAFSADGAKGGHQSEKLCVLDEAQMVPFIIQAEGVKACVLDGKYGQEDVAPTLLGVLNIPERPRFMDGEQILLKNYANLLVRLPEKGRVEVLRGNRLLASGSDDNEFLFLGLEPGSEYKVRAVLKDEIEEKVFLDKDLVVEFADTKSGLAKAVLENRPKAPANSGEASLILGFNPKHLIGYLLIGLVNLTGFLIIIKILKK